MITRIQQLMDKYQITAAELADKLSIERSGISHILSGRNRPSLSFVSKVLEVFPIINPDWLILGVGNMLRKENINMADLLPQQAQIIPENLPQHNIFENELQVSQQTAPQEAPNLFVKNDAQVPQNVNSIKEETILSYTPTIKSEPIVKESIKKSIDSPKEQVCTEIERIIIFYSDRTCAEYKLK